MNALSCSRSQRPRYYIGIASLLSLSLVLAPTPALAQRGGSAEAAELARCIRIAARGYGWLEKTLWGLRKQEAGWIGAEIANTNGTHDLGPLQINSWWVPRIARLIGRSEHQVRHWLRYDACFNVEAARWIVRRQNIRHNSRRRLAECGPRQGVDVRRRTCGAASADVRWSVA